MRPVALLALVTAAVLGLAAPAPAADLALQPARPLTAADLARIQELMGVAPVGHGSWGMRVTDVATGRELYSLNADRRFHAASTTKNFTSAAALDVLGPGHRFRTPVVRDGRVRRDGTLAGDLVLVAAGDLTLGGRRLPGDRVAYTGFDHLGANEVPGFATLTPQDPLAGLDDLARQVRRAGVRRVAGDVVIDDRPWQARRIHKETVSPIVVNDNAIDLTIRPTRPGRRARVRSRPATAAYRIDLRVRTVARGGSTAIEVADDRGDRRIVVTGTIAAGARPLVQVFRVQRPARFARTLFVEALRRNGVRVDAPAVAANRVGRLASRRAVRRLPRVAQLTSPPLAEFVKLIEKVSHNLGANTVPFWLGVHRGRPTFAAGMREIRAFARRAGVPAGGIRLLDGQGGPGNAISPRAATQLLDHVARQPYGDVFRAALPIKGVDGIPDRSDPAKGHVVAKNGINGAPTPDGRRLEVQAMALAGYATAGARRVAFDVVVNHVPILGPDGRYSEDPAVLTAAFTGFGPLEAITTQLYVSQARG